MSYAVDLPRIGTVTAWRRAARQALAAQIPPEALRFDATPGLFATTALPVDKAPALRLSKPAIQTIEAALCHSDPERFDRAYVVLWRLSQGQLRFSDRSDRAMSKLLHQAKEVRRDIHKMHAFVRFREGPPKGGRRAFAAWFEPTHRIVEAATPFFARRFGDMDWIIKTPDLTAIFRGGHLSFEETRDTSPPSDDMTEELWCTYYASIFNPARVMVKAMQSEMPQKYWKNLPEAKQIPDLIQSAPASVQRMAERAPSMPPAHAAAIARRRHGDGPAPALATMDRAIEEARRCDRCAIGQCATQIVWGEGPRDADLMVVGEQPGDQEDLIGRPFVGPAGKVFDRAALQAGLSRDEIYITDAVKHFKFAPRGKRRLHQRPNAGEIQACKWWLDFEIRQVQPRLIVALGATAAEALTGNGREMLRRRGTVERGLLGVPVFLTIHPSFALRLSDPAQRADQESAFAADLELARVGLAALPTNSQTA
ncbi:UdgX family uracil-DNA binding protein [Gymnodinialimonas sp. 2305UL16-5]|uniref:UdgX family uracil-DNA binding protein n=1 Tax=Gymnodinialimonas mytili TaxID=3126503 RepID=UPI00309C7789